MAKGERVNPHLFSPIVFPLSFSLDIPVLPAPSIVGLLLFSFFLATADSPPLPRELLENAIAVCDGVAGLRGHLEGGGGGDGEVMVVLRRMDLAAEVLKRTLRELEGGERESPLRVDTSDVDGETGAGKLRSSQEPLDMEDPVNAWRKKR
ncbi:hypothetical protein HDU67_002327, partial [Dinochytrium kinnereticum]